MFGVDNMIMEKIRQQSNPPILLYHYCKKESAKYLLDRAADIAARSVLKSPNDTNEYSFGVGLFLDYLREKRLVPKEIIDLLCCNLIDNLCVATSCKSSIIPFTFCLTDAFNSAYHWNEFVKDGGGYCMVFSRVDLEDKIRSVVQSGMASLRLERCYYAGHDGNNIGAIVDAICRDREHDFMRLKDSHGMDSGAAIRIMQQICMFAMCIKRERYYQEREWRIIMVANNSREADVNGFMKTGIRDYCKHNDILYLMRGVLSSPAGDKEKLLSTLSAFLDTRKGLAL